jgi:hypothetical protein
LFVSSTGLCFAGNIEREIFFKKQLFFAFLFAIKNPFAQISKMLFYIIYSRQNLKQKGAKYE